MQLPRQVKIVEVAPRDGLQNLPMIVDETTKVAFIDRLSSCGLSAIEVGSLVSSKQVPQMAGSEGVYQKIRSYNETEYILLLANLRGLQTAINKQVKNIAVFCAATDTFSEKNTHHNIKESLVLIKDICEQAIARNISIRGYISCAFGCPYEGSVDIQHVSQLAKTLYAFGCKEISLGDTIGVGTPGNVRDLILSTRESVPVDHLAVHFHDTYGQALANILTSLKSGITIIDSSAGGLGGCPFAPGASGNVATEDLVYMLNGLGIYSGINLPELVSASWFINQKLNRQPNSKVALALKPET